MPASHSSSDHQDHSRLPTVSKPKGAILDAIEHEGVTWEGQVLIVGHDGDIPALLFITTDRLLLTQHDTILLEAPRPWLIPAPLRLQDNHVRLSITPEGVVPGRTTSERLLVKVRDGRGPASQLVAILTGRARLEQMNAEFPSWNTGVGAGRSVALPPLPAFESRQDDTAPKQRDTHDPEIRGVAPIVEWGPKRSEEAAASRSRFQAPEPEPVEPTSRAARFLSNRSNPQRPAAGPSNERPAKVTPIEQERRKRRAGWGIWTTRVAMVVIIALVAGWFGRPYLPDEVTEQLPAIVSGDVATNPTVTPNQEFAFDDGDGTNGAGTDPEDIMPTEVALGLGGATSAIPDAETSGEPSGPNGVLPTPTFTPQETTTGDTGEVSTDQVTNESGETTGSDESDAPVAEEQEPVANEAQGDEPVIEPTIEQVQEPVATEAPPTAEVIATEVPVEPTDVPEVPATETPVPTDVPATETSVPTEVPATETPAPTQVPAIETPIPTEVVVTETPAPTEVPVTETPASTQEPIVIGGTPDETQEPVAEPTEQAEPTLEPQAPSVSPEEPPAQEFAVEGFRYSIDGATTGSSLPELPQVAEVSYGEWVVLSVTGENWSESEQVFDMSRFTLIADGEPIQLDVGNSWVASLLNYTPAYGNTDAILWAPGEEHQFVLTFLAPPDAESLVLQAGDQQFDLDPVLTSASGLQAMRQGTEPETIDATVVDVIDGETIVIEKDGIEQTVRYLGIDIPDGDDCYAEESTEANRALVEGRAVKIERQATDIDARGNWVRDVWVEQEDGRFALVAHQLVQEGAAIADISEPNTRFASWLRGAEAVAQAETRGLWGVCEQAEDEMELLSTWPAVDRRTTF